MFRKELRSLWTVMLVQLFMFGVLAWVDVLLTEIPDALPLYEIYDTDNGDLVFVVFLIAFIVGLGQMVREYDEGTIAFLDTLPTTRTRVYFAKIAAGLVALAVSPLAWFSVSVPVAVWARDSLDESVHLSFAIVTALLIYAAAIVAYAIGAALSPLRRFAWLVLALSLTSIYRFEADLPELSLIKPSELLELRLHGTDRIIPWRALFAQGTLGVLAVLVGWMTFSGAADRLAHAFASSSSSPRGRLVLGCGTLSIVGAICALAVTMALKKVDEDTPKKRPSEMEGVSFARPPPTTIATRAYEIRVPGRIDDDTRARINASDRIHDAVRTWFGAEPVPQISVDASANLGLAAHLGQASWQTVAISADVLSEAGEFERVLAHETAHVYANVISDRRLSDHANTVRLFHEGLASVVSDDVMQRTFPNLAAAFVRKRDLVRTELLFDDRALNSIMDPAHAYWLGVELIRATIDLGGPDAPPRILRAMARPEVPKDLHGITLMRDAYQHAGVDLDRVVERFFVRLDALVAKHKAVLDKISFTQAAVEVDGDLVRITLMPERSVPFPGRCHVRARPDDQPGELFSLRAVEGRCSVPTRLLPLATAEVQVGWLVDDEVLLEAWTEVRIR